MFAARTIRREEGLRGRTIEPTDHQGQYSEEEINQVSRDLHNDGKTFWSKNPRLYIILRDMSKSSGNSHLQLTKLFIDNDMNDTWLPIRYKPILDFLFRPLAEAQYLRDLFIQSQHCVCSQPSDLQLGFTRNHGHFQSKDSSPFISKKIMGNGHIGEVHKVWSLNDGKFYAMKTIPRRLGHFTTASRNVRSFRRELYALRRIDHVHCVKLDGSYTDPHNLAIIMTPVADSNLQQYLKYVENASDPTIILCIKQWFGCLATAVEYIHSIKIRHRDIKPANILVHGRRILLVDFELCLDWKDLCQSTTSADCGGTPLYAAPEVILHKRRNSSSDIWSLGCVFLEMATVLKGRSISQMRDLFKSQAENAIFYNNEVGILQWIDQLKELSEVDNIPFSWITKMLQHKKDLRPKAAAVVDLIRNSPNMLGESSRYFDVCCRPDIDVARLPVASCSDCKPGSKTDQFQRRFPCPPKSRMCQSRIHHSPEVGSKDLPIQGMRSSFHPYFMIRHLTRASMHELTRTFVTDNSWGPRDTGVKVSFLPGQPLHINVRTFVPQATMSSIQRDPESHSIHTHNSIPLGIFAADPLKMAQSVDKFLNSIVDTQLMEHSKFILQPRDLDHSSLTLESVFKWCHEWRHTLPTHEALLLKTAIKIVMINKILGQSLVLGEMPRTFRNGWPHRSSPENQSPKLLNLQLKVALFLLQSTLLEQTLVGLRYLLKVPSAWTTCLATSMCLSFVLEKIIVASRECQKVAEEHYKDKSATASDVDKFYDEVYGGVFQRIYRHLSLSMRSRETAATNSKVTKQLLEMLNERRIQFEQETQLALDSDPDVEVQYPSPLVSALLQLAGTE